MPSASSLRESYSFRYLFTTFFLLYFVQGIPYGLQTRFLPIFFRIHGMSLSSVSLYKLLLIPWVLKAFLAPLIDNYGNKNIWLSYTLLGLSILCIGAAVFPPSFAIQLAIIIFLFNLLTALQDVALDSIVIEILTPQQLSKGNIAQVVGYKIGALFSGGVFSILTEIVSWAGIFYGIASIYFVGFIFCLLFLPQSKRSSSNSHVNLSEREGLTSLPVPGMEDHNSAPHIPGQERNFSYCFNFKKIFKTDGTTWMMIFLLLYKIGEQGITNMFPMYLLDNNISPQTVGFWTGLSGQAVSILGSIIGGLYINEFIYSSLKFCILLRGISAFSIWIFITFWDTFGTISYAGSIISLQLVFLTGGAVTTMTYSLIMHLSKKTPRQCQASHYTVLVTGDVVGRIIFSAIIGSITQWTSYSFVFSIYSALNFVTVALILTAPISIYRI